MRRFILLFILLLYSFGGYAAPKAQLIPFWNQANAKNTQTVDHGVWDSFLKKYGRIHASGINRIRYQAAYGDGAKQLEAYLRYLQGIRVRNLNRSEQKAYWINLYNALTVHTMLQHWPVKSILKVNISPGWFARGPWGAKLLTIEGQKLSLDDIEHGILRPIWRDPLIHYAVNCASLGCPNLALQAYTRENMQSLLKKGAADYINHQRGVKVVNGRLHVSSIYVWFKSDFGDSDKGVIDHLLNYAAKDLNKALTGITEIYGHDYDWSINSVN